MLATAGSGLRLAFRPDIEGLRAVAVLLVVLGHSGVTPLRGGYVGVDVFFVISGFLITSLLVQEVTRTGRISFAGFYARRMLRLLPAATLVLLATLAATWLWLSPLDFRRVAADALSSALYVVNFRLAVQGTAYFAAADSPSPLQHYWSLAVEEQFYVIWPALIVAAAWLALRLGKRPTQVMAWALVPIALASLALSVTETSRSAPWAYFGSHTRAWELAVGALIAIGSARLARMGTLTAAVLSWVGLAAIMVSAVTFTEATPFPGAAAALPVAGAGLLIAAGCAAPRAGAGIVLGLGPMQFVGGLSYGLYLWHWPMLILVPAALGLDGSVLIKVLACAGAMVLAFVSLRYLENPLRHWTVLRAHPRRGAGVGLALSGLACAVALLTPAVLPALIQYSRPVTDTVEAIDGADDPASALRGLLADAKQRDTLPSNVTPSLSNARDDGPASDRDGCHLNFTQVVVPRECAYGDEHAATTVVLFGDSHGAQWLPTLAKLATKHHWRLLSRTKSSCPPADEPTYLNEFKRLYTECDTFRRNVVDEIRQIAPALVIMTSIIQPDATADTPASASRWAAGWTRIFEAVRSQATRVAWLADTPGSDLDKPKCAAAHPTRLSECAGPPSVLVRGPVRRAAIASAAVRADVKVIDPTPWLCVELCPVVVGNVLVYRDAHHMTATYAAMLSPLLEAALAPLP